MDKDEALNIINATESFREVCGAIDEIGEQTNDKNLLLEVFKIAENKANDFNDYRNLAERFNEFIQDKNLLKKYYEKLETKILYFGDCIDFSESVLQNLEDQNWAKNIYKKAEALAADEYDIEQLAECVHNNLKDNNWEPKLNTNIPSANENLISIQQINTNDNYKLIGQEINLFSTTVSLADLNNEKNIRKILKEFIEESEHSITSYPVVGVCSQNIDKQLDDKSKIINSDLIEVEYETKNEGNFFKKPLKDKILLIYYYQYFSSTYNIKFLSELNKVILNINIFNQLAILSDNSKKLKVELEDSDEPSENYIVAFLSDERIIESPINELDLFCKNLSKLVIS